MSTSFSSARMASSMPRGNDSNSLAASQLLGSPSSSSLAVPLSASSSGSDGMSATGLFELSPSVVASIRANAENKTGGDKKRQHTGTQTDSQDFVKVEMMERKIELLEREVADLRDALATAEQREREACRRVFDQSLRQVRDQAAEERERVRQEHEAERKREQQVTKKRIAQVQQQAMEEAQLHVMAQTEMLRREFEQKFEGAQLRMAMTMLRELPSSQSQQQPQHQTQSKKVDDADDDEPRVGSAQGSKRSGSGVTSPRRGAGAVGAAGNASNAAISKTGPNNTLSASSSSSSSSMRGRPGSRGVGGLGALVGVSFSDDGDGGGGGGDDDDGDPRLLSSRATVAKSMHTMANRMRDMELQELRMRVVAQETTLALQRNELAEFEMANMESIQSQKTIEESLSKIQKLETDLEFANQELDVIRGMMESYHDRARELESEKSVLMEKNRQLLSQLEKRQFSSSAFPSSPDWTNAAEATATAQLPSASSPAASKAGASNPGRSSSRSGSERIRSARPGSRAGLPPPVAAASASTATVSGNLSPRSAHARKLPSKSLEHKSASATTLSSASGDKSEDEVVDEADEEDEDEDDDDVGSETENDDSSDSNEDTISKSKSSKSLKPVRPIVVKPRSASAARPLPSPSSSTVTPRSIASRHPSRIGSARLGSSQSHHRSDSQQSSRSSQPASRSASMQSSFSPLPPSSSSSSSSSSSASMPRRIGSAHDHSSSSLVSSPASASTGGVWRPSSRPPSSQSVTGEISSAPQPVATLFAQMAASASQPTLHSSSSAATGSAGSFFSDGSLPSAPSSRNPSAQGWSARPFHSEPSAGSGSGLGDNDGGDWDADALQSLIASLSSSEDRGSKHHFDAAVHAVRSAAARCARMQRMLDQSEADYDNAQRDFRKELELRDILLSRAEAEVERLARENADLLLAGFGRSADPTLSVISAVPPSAPSGSRSHTSQAGLAFSSSSSKSISPVRRRRIGSVAASQNASTKPVTAAGASNPFSVVSSSTQNQSLSSYQPPAPPSLRELMRNVGIVGRSVGTGTMMSWNNEYDNDGCGGFGDDVGGAKNSEIDEMGFNRAWRSYGLTWAPKKSSATMSNSDFLVPLDRFGRPIQSANSTKDKQDGSPKSHAKSYDDDGEDFKDAPEHVHRDEEAAEGHDAFDDDNELKFGDDNKKLFGSSSSAVSSITTPRSLSSALSSIQQHSAAAFAQSLNDFLSQASAKIDSKAASRTSSSLGLLPATASASSSFTTSDNRQRVSTAISAANHAPVPLKSTLASTRTPTSSNLIPPSLSLPSDSASASSKSSLNPSRPDSAQQILEARRQQARMWQATSGPQDFESLFADVKATPRSSSSSFSSSSNSSSNTPTSSYFSSGSSSVAAAAAKSLISGPSPLPTHHNAAQLKFAPPNAQAASKPTLRGGFALPLDVIVNPSPSSSTSLSSTSREPALPLAITASCSSSNNGSFTDRSHLSSTPSSSSSFSSPSSAIPTPLSLPPASVRFTGAARYGRGSLALSKDRLRISTESSNSPVTPASMMNHPPALSLEAQAMAAPANGNSSAAASSINTRWANLSTASSAARPPLPPSSPSAASFMSTRGSSVTAFAAAASTRPLPPTTSRKPPQDLTKMLHSPSLTGRIGSWEQL